MFKDRVRMAREACDMTRAELAQKLGVPIDEIHAWESGEREPNFELTLHLAKALDVQVYGLIGGEILTEVRSEVTGSIRHGRVEIQIGNLAQYQELVKLAEEQLKEVRETLSQLACFDFSIQAATHNPMPRS